MVAVIHKSSAKISVRGLLVLLQVLVCAAANAQGFYAQVNSKKVQVGQAFEYAVVISVNATNFTPPNFRDFDIVSGPNQSNSVQYVNGAMSQQLTISYGLVPKKEGKFTIGPAMIMSSGQRLECNPVAIEVVKSASGGNEQGQGNGKIGGADLFIKTTTSKTKCYLGEQIMITQKVYSRYQIIGLQKFSPVYDGFYSQAQETTSKGQVAVENVDGVNYYTYELFRTGAIASKSGKINLTPIEGDVIIRRQTNTKPRNVFEQFFGAAGYEDVPVGVKSKPMTVEVMDLPEDGKPENFNGAVGSFSYKVTASRSELKANDAFNIKMNISGKGNLKLLSAPKLDLPEGFETYEPKISEGPNTKAFDYLVIPRREGEYKLDNLSFSYFDLDVKKYVTLPADVIKIKVLPPDPNSQGAQVYTPQSQVKETENDIRYIKKGDFLLTKADGEFFNSFTHLFLLVLIVLALSAGLFVRWTYVRANSDQVAVKVRKAAKLARKQLVKAQQLMQGQKKDEFYTEILTALNNYLSHKLNIPAADISRERIQNALRSRQVEPRLIEKLTATLETSEYAKYAPGAVSGDLVEVYNDTVALITDIEEQLNKRAA